MKQSSLLVSFFCLTLLSAGQLKAQETNDNLALDYSLKDYFPLGLSIGLDRNLVSNQANSVGPIYNYQATEAISLGLNSILWSNEVWDLRLSAQYRLFRMKYKDIIPGDAVSPPRDFDITFFTEFYPEEDANLNLTINRNLYKLANKDFYVGLGAQLTYWDKGDSFLIPSQEINDFILTTNYFGPSSDFLFGGTFNLGMDVKTYRFLYRFGLFYHKNFSKARESTSIITSSVSGQFPTQTATSSLNGDYVGFNFTIHPSKNIFKKKTDSVKTLQSQSFTRQLFKEEYLPFSLRIGLIDMNYSTSTTEGIGVEMRDNLVPSIGLTWNYFNFSNFSFNLGVEHVFVNNQVRNRIDASFSGLEEDIEVRQNLSSANHWIFSNKMEYYIPVSDKFSISPGLQLDLRYSGGDQTTNNSLDLPAPLLGEVDDFLWSKRNILFSQSIGVNYHSDHGLFKLSFFTGKSIETSGSQQAVFSEFYNTLTQEVGGSLIYEFKNDRMYGLSLDFFPKRSWFKK